MFNFEWPLWADVLSFLIGAVVIGMAGVKLAGFADRLADRTELGEAVTGTLFLGLMTALPGVAASVTAALDGLPAMAISNALGGIAVQTAALAVADIAYRKANLEHAAASIANMMQTALLVLLLVLVIAGLSGPNVTVGHVHPMTILLFVAAGFAFRLVYRTGEEPMWEPTRTDETVPDVPDPKAKHESLPRLLAGLVIAGAFTLAAGSLAAKTSGEIAAETGLSQTIVGGLFLAIATSLPELVTAVAAVRRGALTLAVSDIVGGNFFDVLFVCAADLVYLDGSLYHAAAVGTSEVFLASLTILLNVVLLMGLIYRQKYGLGNIGFESVLMLCLYVGGFVVMWVMT